jgi:hypothetical protein
MPNLSVTFRCDLKADEFKMYSLHRAITFQQARPLVATFECVNLNNITANVMMKKKIDGEG